MPDFQTVFYETWIQDMFRKHIQYCHSPQKCVLGGCRGVGGGGGRGGDGGGGGGGGVAKKVLLV